MPTSSTQLSLFNAEPADKGKRLDVFLAEKQVGVSRSQISRLIQDGKARVNGKTVKSGHRIRPGDRVSIEIPPPVPSGLEPEEVPFRNIYEDEEIVVLSKPPGVVVHPGAGHRTGTLVHGLLQGCRSLSGIGGVLRPGIVHRLDKDTSGIMVVAKNDDSHQKLSAGFKAGQVHKKYIAIVYGVLKENRGVIQAAIGRHPTARRRMSVRSRKGREARTTWDVVKVYDGLTLVELILGTGRTHQIRVHLASIQHPVVGDPVYGGRQRWRDIRDGEVQHILEGVTRQLLHAKELGFIHPRSGNYVEFYAPMPEDMKAVINSLERLDADERRF
ncbi:MAG: RluA family pseudouridine synthase [Pseudomonadota bacterium]